MQGKIIMYVNAIWPSHTVVFHFIYTFSMVFETMQTENLIQYSNVLHEAL